MSKRFGRKQKRELKQILKIQQKKFISDKKILIEREQFYKKTSLHLENDLYKLKQQIANFLPKPDLTVRYFNSIDSRIEFVEINIDQLRFRFANPHLNNESVQFLAGEFAEIVKTELIKKLILAKNGKTTFNG